MSTQRLRFSRREFVLSVLCATSTAALAYGVCIEPGFLRRSYYRVPVPGFPPGGRIRILHIADLHHGSTMPLSFIEEAFSLGLEMNPDLITITGDLIDLRLENHKPYRSMLQRVARVRPTFATMGNHDGGLWAHSVGGYEDSFGVRAFMEESNVTVLHNSAVIWDVRDRPVRLVGLGDLWAGELDAQSAFGESPIPSNELTVPTVLLSHNPDTKDSVAAFAWHLMLSGHTHGGQLRIPVTGQTPFAPV